MAGGSHSAGSSITALLGPTNTGKTYRALERMLEHRSGMIGLPLRLLAREVYDKLTIKVGESAVALVTGEEKRVPKSARYWVCTVESMPLDREVDFVVVDEIQLCAHHQRGHVFTDRLLRARGRLETWFLGAETMRELIEELVPTAHVQRLTRLSMLRDAGRKSLGALPPHTAVVAFSVPQVYELAEKLRQRKGGAAVVLGALSPRTRNAQVALYQAGEVQHLVATDAIGMGLNLDVDHVAFAATRKFDGKELRPLEAQELAQIAGRAGRFQRDGTFGVLAPLPPLPPSIIDAIETHRFHDVRRIIWRSAELDFSSADALQASLRVKPRSRRLKLVARADDSDALAQLLAMPEVRARAVGEPAVALLWDVCQIPDFRKLMLDNHARLLGEIYMQLTGPTRRLSSDWIRGRLDRLDDEDGDIDTLTTRLAFVRTWNYVASHRRWVDDADHWQARARQVEDRLSDALHDRLTQRFVSDGGRAGYATVRGPRKAKKTKSPTAPIDIDESSPFAALAELAVPDAPSDEEAPEAWAERLAEAPHEAFRLEPSGTLWHGELLLARLQRGADLLHPDVALRVEDLGAGLRSRITRRLLAWTRDAVADLLAPLRDRSTERLGAPGRGLVYLLEQGLGSVRTADGRSQLRRLGARDRERLTSAGVRLGEQMLFVRSTLSPDAVVLRAALVSAHAGRWSPPDGTASSVPLHDDDEDARFELVGYPVHGDRAVRADLAERAARVLSEAGPGPFDLPGELPSLLGCEGEELDEVVWALGFKHVGQNRYAPRRRR